MRYPVEIQARGRLKGIDRFKSHGHKFAVIRDLYGLSYQDTIDINAMWTLEEAHSHIHNGNYRKASRSLGNLYRYLLQTNRDDFDPNFDKDTDDQPRKESAMNLNNAALLIRDDITTGTVVFDDPNINGGLDLSNSKRYTYLIHNSMTLEQGQPVVVHARDTLVTAWFVEYHDEPKIDPQGNDRLKWIVQPVDPGLIRIEAEKTKQLAAKLKVQQARSVREQILSQFNVSSAQELLEG